MWVDVDQGPYLKAVLLLAGILAGPAPLQAQAENGWIGKRVITQYGTVLQVGNQVVDDEGRGKNLARGKEQQVFRIYKVEQANGPWLWLVAEGSGVKGWAPSANVILFDQAIDYVTNQIRANPGSSACYLWRANVWKERKEFDIAIADCNEAIRLDPGYAAAYNNRGLAWHAKKDYDKAIADFNEAIRLDPGYALAYYNRGLAWHAKKDYDRAIADYNEAIRLDPGDALAYYNRGVAFLITGSEKAGDDERKALELQGWRGTDSQYAVLWGHFGARRAGKDDDAQRFLDDAADKCDTAAWPYPVVRYLRGEIGAKALLAAATDTDQMTEARCYLGLDLALKGRDDTAREHYRWVVEHGTPTFTEYTIAAAELERLEKANQARAK
ncbi:MAG: tetratricopeptide repeat protein [Isosphaeraceae bacterium]